MKLETYLILKGLTLRDFCEKYDIDKGRMSRVRNGHLKSRVVLNKVIAATNGMVNCFAEMAVTNGKRWVFDATEEMLKDLAKFDPSAQIALIVLSEMAGTKKVVVTLEIEELRTAQQVAQDQA